MLGQRHPPQRLSSSTTYVLASIRPNSPVTASYALGTRRPLCRTWSLEHLLTSISLTKQFPHSLRQRPHLSRSIRFVLSRDRLSPSLTPSTPPSGPIAPSSSSWDHSWTAMRNPATILMVLCGLSLYGCSNSRPTHTSDPLPPSPHYDRDLIVIAPDPKDPFRPDEYRLLHRHTPSHTTQPR